ncbi:MAG: amidohydrolase family protein [Armatimonadetes bacterium]|nr:amidohydrolase family protein [Armatimonadota bacterium]
MRCLLAPAVLLALSAPGLAQDEAAKAPARAPAPMTYLLKGARVVVKPGTVLEGASILLKDGKIVAVGNNVSAPLGAETIDCTGLTAYAGLVHPYYRMSIDGVTPAQPAGGGPGGGGGGGGRQSQTQAEANAAQAKRDADPFGAETNLLSKLNTGDLKQKDVASLGSLAKAGYGLVQVSAIGGLLGPTAAVYTSTAKELEPSAVVASPGFVPVGLSSRGFQSYPSSAMGAVAFVRQELFDAQRYGRLKSTPNALKSDPAMETLLRVTSGSTRAVFDDLNEVTFFEALKICKEMGIRPVMGFRQDVGAVLDLIKPNGIDVVLRGSIPSKPTIGTNLEAASLSGVRSYFSELQAGAELEHSGVSFSFAPTSTSDPLESLRLYVRAGLSRDAALASVTTNPASLLGVSDKTGTIEVGKLANVMLTQGDLFDSKSQVMAVFVSGQRVDFKMPERKKADDIVADQPMKVMKPIHALFPRPSETTAAFRLYRNATVWTEGPQGTLKNADVLIRDGKVVAVGRGIKAPSGCEVVDATGKHISPGIWDCHSHTGINGGVNEGTNMVTIECRISDVINHQAINIYQQLSGGTVGAQQLHGSANAIGGQTSPVKWRWGMRPTEFPIQGAPLGVKFALGQNPIREDSSGFGQQQQPVGTTLLTWRPRTRMGVEESIRRALQLGKEYNQQWDDYRSGKTTVEPRRDIQLEGLGEIVAGKRFVHSHGYRADELLMLMRVVNEFGGKIATLQHVLEGYKIADEMAGAGVGGSTFADWWGYKLEAYDAIPYNAALMADRGVSVSVNSDSDNHARRLNQEAAKSMRYGGVSPERALSFVTIEPAKQMGIADHTGSLEPGKDADMVVWSADPTSIFAVCLETYVDGVKRFDRMDDQKQRNERLAELEEAKKILADNDSAANPFDSDGSTLKADTGAGTVSGGRSTASFGIGPITSEPGTKRYARKPLLIKGATIHPMTSNPFVGDVLVDDKGKIQQVGNEMSSPDAIIVNARGKHLYPGLIDPATGIGLNEIGQVPASDDSSERGSFHPDYRVERTINPEWETLGVARQQGVLTVLVKPSGSGVTGQAALINTEGYTWEDLTVQGGVALTYSSAGGGFANGDEEEEEGDDDGDMLSGQNRRGGGGGGTPDSYSSLTDQLKTARAYLADRSQATPDKPVPRDQRQEAMGLVADGKLPVLLNVNSATEIKNAVAWAEKEGVRVVLYGCSGAGEIADWLAEKQVPICLAAVYNMPSTEQPVDYFYGLPAKLAKAGVKFCLTTNNDKDVRQIRDQAGWAAAYGLDREEAARSITLRAAEVLGIADRMGAIKKGLDGTLILTDGEVIETKSHVLRAWIEGREVELTNKQTRLYEKYKNRPKSKR